MTGVQTCALPIYSPSWVYVAYGTLIAPTAANAMASVPPLSERSLSCAPNTQFAFALSAATVMVGTDIPQVNVVATFYEYSVPLSLGSAPLSPGGFRYRELLHNMIAVPSGTVIERDLRNFGSARYSITSHMLAATTRFLFLDIWDWTLSAYLSLVATVPWVQNFGAGATFHAGKVVRIIYNTSDGGAFDLSDSLEAW